MIFLPIWSKIKCIILFLFSQAFENLIKSGRLLKSDTDVDPYIVDGKTILSELNHSLQRYYYYAPSFGDDVPSWQPRGKNPRGSDIVAFTNSGRALDFDTNGRM